MNAPVYTMSSARQAHGVDTCHRGLGGARLCDAKIREGCAFALAYVLPLRAKGPLLREVLRAAALL